MEVIGAVQIQARQILDTFGVRHLHVIGFKVFHRLLLDALEDYGSGGDVALVVLVRCKIPRQIQNRIGFGLMIIPAITTA